MSFWTISPSFDDTSGVGPSQVSAAISAPWNSPFAVGSGANATATQTTADPGTLAAIAPVTGSNTTLLYLGLAMIAMAGVIVIAAKKRK